MGLAHAEGLVLQSARYLRADRVALTVEIGHLVPIHRLLDRRSRGACPYAGNPLRAITTALVGFRPHLHRNITRSHPVQARGLSGWPLLATPPASSTRSRSRRSAVPTSAFL